MLEIAVIGIGYIGLFNGILLAQRNEVVAVDIIEEKVRMFNEGKSSIVDREIAEYLRKGSLYFRATLDVEEAMEGAEFVIISTATNYNPEKNFLI